MSTDLARFVPHKTRVVTPGGIRAYAPAELTVLVAEAPKGVLWP